MFPAALLTIGKHWIRQWRGAEQATSHYLTQPFPSSLTHICISWGRWYNSLRPRQNGRHFADDIFKCIFLNGNVWIPIKISLKFVLKGPINDIPALVQIMAWRRPGDKPLSELMLVSLPAHICVTRPEWVKRTETLSVCLRSYGRFGAISVNPVSIAS